MLAVPTNTPTKDPVNDPELYDAVNALNELVVTNEPVFIVVPPPPPFNANDAVNA